MNAEKKTETLRDRLGEWWEGRRDDWEIGLHAYRCYGTEEEQRFHGRVLRDPRLAEASIHDSVWQNIRASFHRFESDEVPSAEIEVISAGTAASVTSDDEGYYSGSITPMGKLGAGWHHQQHRIKALPYGKQTASEFSTECLIPSSNAEFGIISDVDDTVLHTQVGSRWKMALWSLFSNSYGRLPLPGVARLYRDLARKDVNPVFYVSSSPWNLYPVITEFLDAVDLPKGPVLLRDLEFSLGRDSPLGGDHSHKEVKIVNILETYRDMEFILLGDSGQEDATIYSRVAKMYPERIRCAYIRDTGNIDRAMLDEATVRASKAGSELLLVPDSDTIRSHASEHGWL